MLSAIHFYVTFLTWFSVLLIPNNLVRHDRNGFRDCVIMMGMRYRTSVSVPPMVSTPAVLLLPLPR